MKIEVNHPGSKEFYNEMLYVLSYLKRIKKNPKKKAHRIINFLAWYIVGCAFFVAIMVLAYYYFYDVAFIFLAGAMFIIIIFYLIIIFNCSKRIKKYLNDTNHKTIEIDDEYVNYINEKENYRVAWENMEMVLINKYSTCFIPKDINTIIISISNEYIGDILKAIEDYHKEELVIDNRKLYK